MRIRFRVGYLHEMPRDKDAGAGDAAVIIRRAKIFHRRAVS